MINKKTNRVQSRSPTCASLCGTNPFNCSEQGRCCCCVRWPRQRTRLSWCLEWPLNHLLQHRWPHLSRSWYHSPSASQLWRSKPLPRTHEDDDWQYSPECRRRCYFCSLSPLNSIHLTGYVACISKIQIYHQWKRNIFTWNSFNMIFEDTFRARIVGLPMKLTWRVSYTSWTWENKTCSCP